MRRPIGLITLCAVLAACSGGAASPITISPSTTTATLSVPSTTEPVDVDPQYFLLLDGFSAFGVLGDDAGLVIGAFEQGFGTATADSGWIDDHGCAFAGPMRTTAWIEPGVRLVFVDGESAYGAGEHLAAYSTVLPVDPPWQLTGGIRRGMTLADVTAAYPNAELIGGGALDVVRLESEVESYVSLDAAGEIREFFAGGAYC